LNLLEPIGQFGSRHLGGKDSASARYIYTKLNTLTRYLFKEEDDKILSYLSEEGINIEPKNYMPILPTVLINGGEGIGTGWSTSIPPFHPKDIVENVKRLISGEEMVPMHPWFKGFLGKISQIAGDNGYLLQGNYKIIDEETIHITELPP
jgi:DNA topoisomerase II